MVEKRTRKTNSRQEKTRDPRTASRFIEELSWLLQSYSNFDFKVLQEMKYGSVGPESLEKAAPSNPNIRYLVGTLPSVFNDLRFFPANEDISDFANDALGLNITRWDKRSRYELIGLIVCETAKLDDQRLGRLVEALTRITDNDTAAQMVIAERKANSLSWNELIQLLTGQNDK